MTIKERIGFVTMTIAAAFVGGAVSGHMFAASAIGAASAPKMLTAQKFLLVDSNGAPALGIFGKNGKTRVEVGLNSNSVSRIVLFDPQGKSQASFGVGPDGQSGLALMDKEGNPRATLIVAPDGS